MKKFDTHLIGQLGSTGAKRCPRCEFGYAWDGFKCQHCDYRRVKKMDGETTSAVADRVVEAGSGGKLIPRPPSPTMRMMREAYELSQKGMSHDGISKQMEKSVGWVKGSCLIVRDLPVYVHKAIEEHRISRIAALQLLLCPPENLQRVVEACVQLSETEGKL